MTLLATPALAEEKRPPAVTTPDTAAETDDDTETTPLPDSATPRITANTTPPTTPSPSAPPTTKPTPEPEPGTATAAPTPALTPTPTPTSTPTPTATENADRPDTTHAKANVDLRGVPETITAGGAWHEFAITIEPGEETGQLHTPTLHLANLDDDYVDTNIEVQYLANGSWHAAKSLTPPETFLAVYLVWPQAGVPLPTGMKELPIRFRAHTDAPNMTFHTSANIVDGVSQEAPWYTTNIISSDPGEPGDPGDPGNPGDPGDPGDPGSPGDPGGPGHPSDPGDPGDPGDPAHPGNPGDTGIPGDTGGSSSHGTGGELAHTGSDATSSWALGLTGTALGLGAALIAGTGRHRRRTHT
ncbi:hypothetical protein ABTX82_33135 [Streptomyces lavendulae]|uniref:hypothetical protein n=1 Tax=Streptomyces lavendulae TaxID=1914 RepID=UPI00332AEDDF